MTHQIGRIVIVGGGSAGWLTAAYLNKMLCRSHDDKMSITLVESDEVGPIGVGEATIPSFVAFLRSIDVPEWRLIAEADATFKNAIKFVNWDEIPLAGSPASSFYHQFDPPPFIHGQSALVHWLALKDAGLEMLPLDQSTSIGSALCEANRSPKLFNSPPYEAPVPYAYHLDAVKLGALLRAIVIERGVERVVGHVDTIQRSDNGDISGLTTRDGQYIEGDLFIDCTGFSALLIEGALGEPFQSHADRLLCDRAVACQVSLDAENSPPRCYTTATAKRAGWTWEIDLGTRSGVGYVYSSQFTSDDEAAEQLKAQVGADRQQTSAPRIIGMRIGRRRDCWVNNCVAIGLSAGFLEPLESTGLHLVELGVRLLVDHLSEGPAQTGLRRHYNKLMADVFDDISDFLVMHYILNGRRSEPFWDHYRNNVAIPDSLKSKLELWAFKVPASTDLVSKIIVFDGFSYMAVMAGLGVRPQFGGNLSPFMNLEMSASALDEIISRRAIAVRSLPSHADMIQRLRSISGG